FNMAMGRVAVVDATAAGDAMARLRDRGVPSWPCGVVRDRRDGEAGDAEAKGGGGGAALVLGEHPA
ncbi:MAG: phosphoribosylformylglycinamidine cyclo-ligase, partial [Candidatus Nanopelagicales bacterium]